VLEHPLLDALEAIVVLVQDLFRAADIEIVFGPCLPGEREEIIEVGEPDGELG